MVVSAASENLRMTTVTAAGRRRFNGIFWAFSYTHATPLRPDNYSGVIRGQLGSVFFPCSAPSPQTLCSANNDLQYSPFTAAGPCLLLLPISIRASLGKLSPVLKYKMSALHCQSASWQWVDFHLTWNVPTGCWGHILVPPFSVSSAPSTEVSTQKCRKFSGRHIQRQFSSEIGPISRLWSLWIEESFRLNAHFRSGDLKYDMTFLSADLPVMQICPKATEEMHKTAKGI